MCNDPKSIAPSKNISVDVSISRPESRSAGATCTIYFLSSALKTRPVGCCLTCTGLNRTLPDNTPCYALRTEDAKAIKPFAQRSCPLGQCQKGVCSPTGEYELCGSALG
ncbi:evasin P991-like [Dermacentor silvarum]|uniref:evasin P991-like n=1 Tax=Dermacentor silvarum TaxID=543639 RepID=UPI002101AE97|nr:evasin P991-like [Dermacentor silvarum]